MVLHADANFDSPRTRVAPCPVDESSFNDTGEPEAEVAAGRCACVPGGDIRCHGGVRALPRLTVEHLRHAPGTSFAGFPDSKLTISFQLEILESVGHVWG